VIAAVADRLVSAGATGAGPTVLAAVDSSRPDAHAEVAAAASALAARLGRPVEVLPLRTPLEVPAGAEVAVYLLAEGGFLDLLRGSAAAVVADPIGVHPALVELVWARYEAALR
jgi:sirohydrochlorin ferrochelatase